ncbi:IPT/TIG domain-containing protein [Flavivirga amylovorans]|uniref:IPT/TIG domain-containing protein n=1 Tax=Flavivirga amylovorans TaxID=870486 RepID=A0ABT8WVW2_9FLAO|nr:IPT/TIG domain-containing protein [Flavivirga amylovorans]MDO5985806.1 IPT/TIG domain-containing protein [Flavivirga amylovorans]
MCKKYKFLIITLVAILSATIFYSCEDEDYKVIPPSQLENPHSIISIVPDFVDVGTEVTLHGANFSLLEKNNQVRFNGILGDVQEATDTTLVVIVPDDATTGVVSVSIAKVLVEGPVFSVVPAPKITDLSVTGAAIGETITITGENFRETPSENIVMFNGIIAEVIAASKTELTVIVPDGATTGSLTVDVLGQIDTAFFTIAPTITSFTPATSIPGTEVIINGTNFSTDANDNNVSFNGTSFALVVSATTTQLVVIVPSDATTGPISVEIESLLAVSSTPFTIDSTTLVYTINSVEDDVEEAVDGRMTLDSADLELGEFDTFGTPDVGLQKIGLRFNGVMLPSNATILNASIQFVADQTPGSNPTEMTIYGEAIGDALPYTDVINNLSDRTLTTSSAIWSIPPWNGTEAGPNQQTVDISNIIREIRDLGDWASGNSMNFIFEATGVSAGATANNVGREAETYDDANPQEGARLIITISN